MVCYNSYWLIIFFVYDLIAIDVIEIYFKIFQVPVGIQKTETVSPTAYDIRSV